MKITVKNNNKLVPFEDIPIGMVFKDPVNRDMYYIKAESVLDENTDEEELNSFCINNNTFNCFGPQYMVQPIYGAELIIP